MFALALETAYYFFQASKQLWQVQHMVKFRLASTTTIQADKESMMFLDQRRQQVQVRHSVVGPHGEQAQDIRKQ